MIHSYHNGQNEKDREHQVLVKTWNIQDSYILLGKCKLKPIWKTLMVSTEGELTVLCEPALLLLDI